VGICNNEYLQIRFNQMWHKLSASNWTVSIQHCHVWHHLLTQPHAISPPYTAMYDIISLHNQMQYHLLTLPCVTSSTYTTMCDTISLPYHVLHHLHALPCVTSSLPSHEWHHLLALPCVTSPSYTVLTLLCVKLPLYKAYLILYACGPKFTANTSRITIYDTLCNCQQPMPSSLPGYMTLSLCKA